MSKSTSNQATKKQSGVNEAAYIFADAMKRHSDDDAKAFALKTAAHFDERVQFEISRKPHNTADMPKVKKLNGYRAKLAMPMMSKVLMELGVSSAFINAHHGKDPNGDRFNIYAIDKICDLVQAFMSGKLSNAHNVAIGKSMLNFEEANVAFTGDHAMMASSDKIRSQDPNVKLLRRHSVDKNTAPTQSSSTLNGLLALGLIINTGTRRAATYVFAETKQALAFKELLKAV